MKLKPQILVAILVLGTIAVLVIFHTDDGTIEKLVGGVVTAIGMLGMKLLENE